MTCKFKVGDSVVVKQGVIDPDFNTDINGWQGRVVEIDDDTIFLEWDSVTLKQMGLDLIIRCENENLDWRVITLEQNELEIKASRDSESDVQCTANALCSEMIDDPRLDNDQ